MVLAVVGVVVPSAGAGGLPLAELDRGSATAWAWCGVEPAAPNAARIVSSMARDSGIDITFGPCRAPGKYSVIDTGTRYAPPDVYRQLVTLNASVGMKTVVFDARLWDPDPTVRAQALQSWLPYVKDIAAWDLGDEYNPDVPSEWDALVFRWATVRAEATAATGVRPFANHLPWAAGRALLDLPGVEWMLSFAQYGGDRGASLARFVRPQVEGLMCGVNTLEHLGYVPTPQSIVADSQLLQSAGCTDLLIFGGVKPSDTPEFQVDSVVDVNGAPTASAPAVLLGAVRPDDGSTSVAPVRIVETRVGAGSTTVDGSFSGIGRRAPGSTMSVQVAGRAAVPFDATAVTLNVTVVDPSTAGYVTVFPCGRARPVASTVNFGGGDLPSNTVRVKLGQGGSVCVFTQVATDIVIDLVGFDGQLSRYRALEPARLVETRPRLSTVDGNQNGIGRRSAGTVTVVQVGGRAGVPVGATSAVLTLTVVGSAGPGFATWFPCADGRPNASTINFDANALLSNTVVVPLDATGAVCLYTMTATDVVVDVGGYQPQNARLIPVAPARLLETRSGVGLATVDGAQLGIGRRLAGSTLALPVRGRGGVAGDAEQVTLNVTVIDPAVAGFVTVWPCDQLRPATSSLNFRAGVTISNSVSVSPSAAGTVCVYTLFDIDLVVDVNAYEPGSWPMLLR